MTEHTESKKWQSILPEAFTWLERVKLDEVQEPSANGWTVVCVEKPAEGATIDAPGLSAEWRSKLETEIKSMNWKGKPQAQRLKVNGKTFLVVSTPTLDVTAVQKARQAGLDAGNDMRESGASDIVIVAADKLPVADFIDGFLGAFYEASMFKAPKKQTTELPTHVGILGKKMTDTEKRERLAMAKTSMFVRMLQDAPANWLDPERFSTIAKEAIGQNGAKVGIFGREDLKSLGMGSFLSVAAGSPRDPRMVVIEIEGQRKDQTVALVGKGVTFDSGGISIKPGPGMGEMKYDMSGAAAVFGAAYYLSQVKPPVNVVCIMGCVENMPSGTATRPGDVVQAMNGKTIEVLNTDAEGRLVLCDLLAYAQTKFKPEFIIDIATLTGAVIHGLGHAGAAFMTHKDETARFMEKVSAQTGEPMWRLPLWAELAKETKGDVADLKNIAKPNVMAGTIIGGLFLKEFVEDAKCQWAHVDIAGTAWSCAATGYPSSGGSAFGLRALVKACFEWGA